MVACAVNPYVRACIVLLTVSGQGCVALQPSASPDSAILLTVRLAHGAAHEVSGLIVSVADESNAVMRQFAFVPSQRVPRSHTNFLVRLDLPVGHYRLRYLTGVVNSASIPTFDVDAQLPFDVRAREIGYLGRLELDRRAAVAEPAQARPTSTPAMLSVRLIDAHQEDVPSLLDAWPILRMRGIERRSPSESTAPGRSSAAAIDGAYLEPRAGNSSDSVRKPALHVVRSVRPQYPEAALLAGYEGYVDLQFIAAADGKARDIEVVGSQPSGVFDEAAIRALRDCRFAPSNTDAKVAEQRASVRVRFQIADHAER